MAEAASQLVSMDKRMSSEVVPATVLDRSRVSTVKERRSARDLVINSKKTPKRPTEEA